MTPTIFSPLCKGSCVPWALAYVFSPGEHAIFRDVYNEVCGRIHAMGGDYEKVTHELMSDLLTQNFSVKSFDTYSHKPLSTWLRGRDGVWVATITPRFRESRTSHCVVFGARGIHDNGFALEQGGFDKLKVQCAWNIAPKEAV